MATTVSLIRACTTEAEVDQTVASITDEGTLEHELKMAGQALHHAKEAHSSMPTPATSTRLALATYVEQALRTRLGKPPKGERAPSVPGSRAASRVGSVIKGSLAPTDFANRAITALVHSACWTEEVKTSLVEYLVATDLYQPDQATADRIRGFEAAESLPEGAAREAILAALNAQGGDPRQSMTPPTWGELPKPAPAATSAEAPTEPTPSVAAIVAAHAAEGAKLDAAIEASTPAPEPVAEGQKGGKRS